MSEQAATQWTTEDIKADRERRLVALREKLVFLAHEMMFADIIANGDGVAFFDVRQKAEDDEWMAENEWSGRELSFGANVMRDAGGHVWGYLPSKHKLAKNRLVGRYRLTPPPIAENAQEPR